MTELAFTVTGASKSFGALKALDRIDLSVARGEFIALIGPSGSGKSTLLRSLNGLVAIDADGGRIEAFGHLLQEQGRVRSARRTRARIGFVFQQFNLVGRLSLFSNVMIGALARVPAWRGLLGVWPPADRRRGVAALERTGVAAQAAQKASTLSGGQQQRGAIARALVQGAEALLADEPVASLDPAASRKVMEILRSLSRDDGLTVLVTLHQVDHAVRYCGRVLALRAGRIVFDGPPSNLTRELLAEIYGEEIEEALPLDSLP